MDNNYPKNSDPRPKRRRSKDNPYEIYSVGAHTDRPYYYIAFTDSTGVRQELEIDKTLFDTLDRFELDDLSCFTARERPQPSYNYRAVPGGAMTGNGDNDTPVQPQPERDSDFRS